MFARFKSIDGKEFNVVPYRVIGLTETDTGTIIVAEGGLHAETADSIRKVRSALTKVAYPVSPASEPVEQPEAEAA